MNLIEQYNSAVAEGVIHDDALQREIVAHLQQIVLSLNKPIRPWFRLLHKKNITGMYLYGPVGAGKTYLMDLFFKFVPIRNKLRLHFHHFMQQIDAELRRLQGKPDPLQRIIEKFAKKVRLLCLDEFLVHDVADAIILAEILQGLVKARVVLIITSNDKPDSLYLNGVQRARFLPAIALIKQHCEVLKLAPNKDYRLGHQLKYTSYHYPLNDETQHELIKQFALIETNAVENQQPTINVQNRQIPCEKLGAHTVWFKFNTICNIPRCALDYLEIATRFSTIFLSDIPVLTAENSTRVLLLMHFIDIIYDNKIRLVISAQEPFCELATDSALPADFQRTRSRLEEMMSKNY